MKGMVLTALLILLSLGLVSVTERVVFAQASQYPVWLATGTIPRLVAVRDSE